MDSRLIQTEAASALACESFYDPFMDEVFDGDPYPLYRRLRDESPRLFLPRYNAWFFSRFEDVWQLSKERTLSVAQGLTTSQLLLGAPAHPLMVSQMDPPQHTLYRSLLNEIFKPAAAAALENCIRDRAVELLEPIRARGGGDMMADFGSPLAAEVGCMLSGLPAADVGLQIAWNKDFFDRTPGHRGDTETGARAYLEMMQYIVDRVAAVRRGAEPASGTLKVLLDAQERDDSITDDHIVNMVFNMQIAAGDTVPKGIAATLYRLSEAPAQRELLQANPGLAHAAFMEGTRLDMPTQMQGRIATECVELGDMRIEPGHKTMLLFASASRDEREFRDSEAFRIDRDPRRTLVFGNGIHRCLGVHVAQVEGTVAIEAVMDRLPQFRIDPVASLQCKTEFLKGWASLCLRL
jgi:cytochrome P450